MKMPLKKAAVDWDSLGFDLLKTRSMYSANCRWRKLGKWIFDTLW